MSIEASSSFLLCLHWSETLVITSHILGKLYACSYIYYMVNLIAFLVYALRFWLAVSLHIWFCSIFLLDSEVCQSTIQLCGILHFSENLHKCTISNHVSYLRRHPYFHFIDFRIGTLKKAKGPLRTWTWGPGFSSRLLEHSDPVPLHCAYHFLLWLLG